MFILVVTTPARSRNPAVDPTLFLKQDIVTCFVYYLQVMMNIVAINIDVYFMWNEVLLLIAIYGVIGVVWKIGIHIECLLTAVALWVENELAQTDWSDCRNTANRILFHFYGDTSE